MYSELEDETRDFLTIYKKEFPKKETERRKAYKHETAYPLPLIAINGSFRKCLNTRNKNVSLPVNEQTEDPQEVLNKIRNDHPSFKKFLPETVPNEDLIEKTDKEVTQTVYQVDYSKGDYSPRTVIFGRRKDIELPECWVISETIHGKSYRNPWEIATEKLLRLKRARKPPDNLIPNEKEREILRTRTGDSEYNATIDATGSYVIKKRLFGAPLVVEPKIYTKDPDSAPSECSEILAGKKFAIPSNVL